MQRALLRILHACLAMQHVCSVSTLAHYNFIKLLGPERCGESTPGLILSYGLKRTVRMDVNVYLCWLDDAIHTISSGIEALVALNDLAPGISAEQRV